MKGILILLACTALPVAAQQPSMRHDEHSRSAMMSHMNEMMAPMMGVMAYAPDHLLDRKESLKLTAQQVTRLTALQDGSKKAHEQCAADAKPHLDAIAQGLRAGTSDTVALKQHFDAAHTAMGKGHWTMFGIALQAQALLTEEQRAQVDRWSKEKSEHEVEHH
jgi:hypothetical protein